MARKWIQRAIRRPGALTRWAKRHGVQPPFSEADLNKLESIARRLPASERRRRLAQINLARTLKRIRK